MALKTITVPDAGDHVAHAMTGLSVIVVNAPAYFSPDESPKLSFDNPGAQLPVENRNVFPSDKGSFKRIIVTGTSASAGDEITLLTLDNCLELSVQGYAGASKAEAGNTFTIAMDNSVKQFSEFQIIDADGNLPRSVYISAGGGDIHYRWNDDSGTDPSPGSDADYVLADHSEPIEILGIDFILNLRFVNAVTDETPNLIVTCRY